MVSLTCKPKGQLGETGEDLNAKPTAELVFNGDGKALVVLSVGHRYDLSIKRCLTMTVYLCTTTQQVSMARLDIDPNPVS